MASNIWRCKCGHVEYGKFPPEECPKCWKIDCFKGLSEDAVEEIEEDLLGDIRADDWGEDSEW